MAEHLIDYIKQLEKKEPPEFSAPQFRYGPAEDALVFYISNTPSYASRADELVTIFLSFENDELVGCQIKGVKNKLHKDGNFEIAIKGNRVELGLIFLLFAYDISEPGPRNRLVDLAQRAKGFTVNTEDFELVS